MFVIFSFNTPGEHINGWPFSMSPTYEGIREGLVQLLRINVMLAALSILLATNNKQQLISGFYSMLSPLKRLGIEVERFAARLWLTLHYVEVQQQLPRNAQAFSNLGNRLTNIFTNTQHDEVTILLEKPIFTWLDNSLIALMLAFLAHILFKAAV
jgi:energy-coupling factor transport system permease protein